MFELINIFEVFLPQLLQDPNPKDPLNGEAAMLLLKDPEKYKLRVREYVKKYALKDKTISNETINTKNNQNSNQNNGITHSAKNGNINNNVEESKSVHSELSNASENYDSDGKA